VLTDITTTQIDKPTPMTRNSSLEVSIEVASWDKLENLFRVINSFKVQKSMGAGDKEIKEAMVTLYTFYLFSGNIEQSSMGFICYICSESSSYHF
jgi:hypothetical protein